jgi:thioredoxin-like negative regulator of GroEL
VKFVKVNTDNAQHTAAQHGVRGVPALFFYKNGSIVKQAVGALPKSEIDRRLRELL